MHTRMTPSTSLPCATGLCSRHHVGRAPAPCNKRAASKELSARSLKVVVRSGGHNAPQNGVNGSEPRSDERFISVSDLLDEVDCTSLRPCLG